MSVTNGIICGKGSTITSHGEHTAKVQEVF